MRCRHLLPLTLLLTACSKTAPAPAPEAAPAPAEVVAPVDDDKPHLALKPEGPAVDDHGTVALSANGILHVGALTYVSAPLPPDTGLLRTQIAGEVYALGMVTPHEDAIIVRFNAKQAPATFDVNYEAPGEDGSVVGRGVFRVTVGKDAAKRASLEKEFFDGLAEWFAAVSEVVGADGFYAYASQRALTTGTRKTTPEDYALADIEDAMALYTGARSLRDALQAERALKIKRSGKQTIAVASITPVPLEPHDWPTLTRELGAKPSVEPLAAAVPASMLYLHATSATALHKTVSALTDQLAGLVEATGIESATGDIVDRYAAQLGLEHSATMSALADTAIDGIALASSDPFFREGTDVTVFFHATNRSVLEAALAGKEQTLAGSRSTYKVGAHEVSLTATPDTTVSRHRVVVGDVVIISNSRAAIEACLAVADGKAPSLATSGDFNYLRALYPYERSKEDAFVFVGDDFVAHVVSPAFKIASARRVFALADVQAARYEAMYKAWLDGKAQPNAKIPVRAFGAPLVEQKVDKVTADERDAYTAFVSEYQARWRKLIDPTAIRMTITDTALTLDARMLPLTTRGEYTDIEQLAGTARVAAPSVRDGIAWVAAVGPEAPLRRELEGTGRSMMGGDFQLGWLGGWVMAGVSDRPGLYDMAIASGALGEADVPEGEPGLIPPIWRSVLTHAPLYVGAEVRNPMALAGLLTGAKTMVEQAAPGFIEWTADEPIDDVPVSVIREGASSGAPASQRIAIRYAVFNGAFIASLDRPTLIAQLAALKGGHGPKAAPSVTGPLPSTAPLENAAQATIDYAPGAWLSKIVGKVAERAAHFTQLRTDFAQQAVAPYLNGVDDATMRAAITRDLLGYAPHAADAAKLTTDLTKLRKATMRVSIEGADNHRGLHTAVTLTE